MSKCPINNFQDCIKDKCAWYFNSLDRKCCAVQNMAQNDMLTELPAIQRNISDIQSILNERLIRK